MFSYKSFIKSCLTGKSEKRSLSKPVPCQFPSSSLEGRSVQINSLNFSSIPAAEDRFFYSPRVPQLPSMSIPMRLTFTHRAKSITRSPCPGRHRSQFSNREGKSLQIQVIPADPEREDLKLSPFSSVKVSKLNTNYCCGEEEIMKSMEKAKQYFPIPLGRKHLRTSSLSISHTPMSRLYSPQNFMKREKKHVKDSKDFKDLHEKNARTGKEEEKNNRIISGFKEGSENRDENGKKSENHPKNCLNPPQGFLQASNCFSPRFEVKTGASSIYCNDLDVEGRKAGSKYRVRTSKPLKRTDLYDLLINFSNQLELFKRKFYEIDKHNKGYLLYEDFRICYGKNIADSAVSLFGKVSGRKQVFLADFLAVCAVFLHNGGQVKGFQVDDLEVLNKLEEEVDEIKNIFEVHTKGTVIPRNYLQGVTQFLQPGEDVLKAESLVLGQTIDFAEFLRWIPYFLYIHVQLLNKAFQ